MVAASNAPATAAAGSAPVLAVDDVTVTLSGRRVLDGVSFAVQPGEFVGLIGSNGAGKTTLLRVILGLQRELGGSVTFGGGRSGTGASRSTTNGVGYLPQKVLLDPDLPLRARDVVALGIDGAKLGIPFPNAKRRALVDELLQAVGASGFADARVGLLSGGQQQRILIAHAIASNPPLLLLDEPLANLDIASSQEIVELLASICRERGIAVLLSAHDLNPLLGVMDRIVYLEDGRAVSGPTDEVVQSEVLSRLYGRPVDVLRVAGRVLVVAGPDDTHGHDR